MEDPWPAEEVPQFTNVIGAVRLKAVTDGHDGFRTELKDAIRSGDVAKVRALAAALPEGFDVNKLDGDGSSLLHDAILSKGGAEMIEAVVDSGIDMTVVNGSGDSAYKVMADKLADMKDGDDKKRLTAQAEMLRFKMQKELSQTFRDKNRPRSFDLIKAGAGGQGYIAPGITFLMAAAERGDTEMIDALLKAIPDGDRKAFINMAGVKGWTALHFAAKHAAQNGDRKAYDALVKAGGDPDQAAVTPVVGDDRRGPTPAQILSGKVKRGEIGEMPWPDAWSGIGDLYDTGVNFEDWNRPGPSTPTASPFETGDDRLQMLPTSTLHAMPTSTPEHQTPAANNEIFMLQREILEYAEDLCRRMGLPTQGRLGVEGSNIYLRFGGRILFNGQYRDPPGNENTQTMEVDRSNDPVAQLRAIAQSLMSLGRRWQTNAGRYRLQEILNTNTALVYQRSSAFASDDISEFNPNFRGWETHAVFYALTDRNPFREMIEDEDADYDGFDHTHPYYDRPPPFTSEDRRFWDPTQFLDISSFHEEVHIARDATGASFPEDSRIEVRPDIFVPTEETAVVGLGYFEDNPDIGPTERDFREEIGAPDRPVYKYFEEIDPETDEWGGRAPDHESWKRDIPPDPRANQAEREMIERIERGDYAFDLLFRMRFADEYQDRWSEAVIQALDDKIKKTVSYSSESRYLPEVARGLRKSILENKWSEAEYQRMRDSLIFSDSYDLSRALDAWFFNSKKPSKQDYEDNLNALAVGIRDKIGTPKRKPDMAVVVAEDLMPFYEKVLAHVYDNLPEFAKASKKVRGMSSDQLYRFADQVLTELLPGLVRDRVLNAYGRNFFGYQVSGAVHEFLKDQVKQYDSTLAQLILNVVALRQMK
jgi:ankyrin repeat protein